MKEINCLNLCDIWGQATKDKKKIIELIRHRGVERVYIGSYFCGNYFINLNENDINLFFSQIQKEIKLTLVIPIFNQSNLYIGKERIKKITTILNSFIDEICVNDYGMLQYSSDHLDMVGSISLGRLFMKEYRDPRYHSYFNRMIQPKIFTSYFSKLCKQYNIIGAEIDPTHEGIVLSEAPEGIEISMHTPLCYLTVGQICEISSLQKDIEKKFRPNDKCNYECTKYNVQYFSEENLHFIKFGRAVYFENHITKIEGTELIRIIYFPLTDLGLFTERIM